MGLKDIVNKLRSRNDAYKELEVQDRAMNKLQQRKLSSEERALNKIMERKRQENIKKKLSSIYKQEEKEYWHKDVISQKNLFKDNKNLFKNNRRVI